jgi:hypothetical protein
MTDLVRLIVKETHRFGQEKMPGAVSADWQAVNQANLKLGKTRIIPREARIGLVG